MYKVLIVDDEVLLRVGLKTTLNWEEIGFTVVAEAANGEQGYEQYKKHSPDVVITDIKMPKQDGLWLVEKVRKENEHVAILVLTCHDEFMFVRQALKSGADDYILKSEVEDEELLNIMNKVKKKLDKHNENRDINQTASTNKSDLRRTLFNDLIKADFDIEEKLEMRCSFIGFPLKHTRFVFASVSVSSIESQSQNNNTQINQALINILFNLLKDREIDYIYHHYNNQYHFVLSSYKLNTIDVKRIFVAANESAKQYFDRALYIVYTNIFEDYNNLNNEFMDFINKTEILFYKYDDNFYLENTKYIDFQDINTYELKKKYSQFLFIDNIIQNNMENALEFIDELYLFFKEKHAYPKSVKLFFSDFIASLFHQYSGFSDEAKSETSHERYHYKIINAMTLKDTCDIMKNLLGDIALDMQQYVKNNANMLTGQAVRYIEQHIDEKLSLKDVAEHLNLSKHYLCSVFKKETGDNMSHYINTLRIEKAKKLILKKDKKIKEIFEEVGYSNQQYFSKVFKQITGMTVMEYKEKQSLNNVL